MDYNHITNFLNKFKKIVSQKEELKEVIIKVIKEEVSFQLEKELIKIKGSSIYIESSPILRSEILIHKNKILEKIKNILPDSNFSDIK
jgi:pyruvate/2-oxoglutarate/acetoin dehydrogenase E1 component